MDKRTYSPFELIERSTRLRKNHDDPVQALGLLTIYLDDFSAPRDIAGLLIAIGNCHKDIGNPEEALAAYLKARTHFPDIIHSTIHAADMLVKLDLLDQAETLFQEALQKAPLNGICLEGMKTICARTGRQEEARRYENILRYEKGIKFLTENPLKESRPLAADDTGSSPDSDLPHGSKKEKSRCYSIIRHAIRLRKERDNPKEALEFLEEKLGSFSTPRFQARIHTGIGDCHKAMNKRSKALAAYETAINLDPLLPIPLVSSASVLIDQKKFTEAATRLDQALQLSPDDARIFALRERMEMLRSIKESRDNQKPPSCIAPPLQPSPATVPPPPLSMEEVMRKRIAINGRDIGARKVLAEILLGRGEREEARTHLEAVLAVDKLNSEAKRLLRGINDVFTLASSGQEFQEIPERSLPEKPTFSTPPSNQEPRYS